MDENNISMIKFSYFIGVYDVHFALSGTTAGLPNHSKYKTIFPLSPMPKSAVVAVSGWQYCF